MFFMGEEYKIQIFSYEKRLSLLLEALILLTFCIYELKHINAITYGTFASNSDEGIYIASSELLAKGFALFRDVFSSQPAFYLSSLAAFSHINNDSIISSHIYEAFFGLVTLVSVCWIGWAAYRPYLGVVASLLLAVTPGFAYYSHIVVAETPMLSFGVAAIAAAQTYYFSGRRLAIGLAGILLMIATEMKLLSVLMILPIGLLWGAGAWQRHRSGKSLFSVFNDGIVFVLCFFGPIIIFLLLVDTNEQFNQVILFHIAASHALPLDVALNWDHLGGFFWRYDPVLLVIAASGCVLGLHCKGRRYLTFTYMTWFFSSLLFLITYHPEAQHNLLPLLPPLSLLGGIATTGLLSDGNCRIRDLQGKRSLAHQISYLITNHSIPSTCCALYCLFFITRTIPLESAYYYDSTIYRNSIVSFIDRVTKPMDFIVCNIPIIPLEAHRLMPPGMEDLSGVRVAAGYLTAREAIASTERYRPKVIIIVQPQGDTFAQGYLRWLSAHYHMIVITANRYQIYLRGK